MSYPSIPFWKEAPFVRLIIPFVAGIVLEWYFGNEPLIYIGVIFFAFVLIILFSFVKSFSRFKHYWLSGVLINSILIGIGGLITYNHDLRHSKNFYTNPALDVALTVTLQEPLVEKANSFKAIASINSSQVAGKPETATGNIIIYFQKDSSLENLNYGSRLVFNRRLQAIKNSGNPGAFDYRRYCEFQQIYYQVYLRPVDYVMLSTQDGYSLNGWLFNIRKTVVAIIQTFIAGEKEAGLAEALLIGYKDDLDKNLVQLYSNTGVVHIIAISGLHLGLIYWLLSLILKPLKARGRLRWMKAILIISALWVFSLLTGGSASVCRSALMFSLIIIGENMERKTNIYNSLAASAFLLLCYNPYCLWDVGFQLSYIAVLSIVIFMKPVYNWFYIKNKMLDHTWKMAAVSIAAQILTTPASIFHFQQFPNYFLITNLVAVPLSSLIVLAEIGLCSFSFLPGLASWIGIVTAFMIRLMNNFVAYINKMPLTTTGNLTLSPVQLILSYIIIALIGYWLLNKTKTAFMLALAGICCFAGTKAYLTFSALSQHKIIVYNITHRKAIDVINARNCISLCDSIASHNAALEQFSLTPSRNHYRVSSVEYLESVPSSYEEVTMGNKRVVILNNGFDISLFHDDHFANIIILSGNPRVDISQLVRKTTCMAVVFDCTNSNRNIMKWKRECKKINLLCHSVAENGAFIFNLN